MRSHWWITWKLADGSSVRDTTRGRLEPVTEEDLRESLLEVLAIAAQDRPEPLVWVKDADRADAPTLIFTAHVVALELERDAGGQEPAGLKEEAERHLQAVRDPDPGQAVPPELGTVQDLRGGLGEWDPTGLLRSLERDPFLGPPAGRDRFA